MTDWKGLLYEALASQFGTVVSTSDADAAKQALYRARSQTSDPSLGCLQFRTSLDDPAGEIWIVKSKVNGRGT